MSITASEIIWRKPASVSDGASNGGRSTAGVIPTQVKNSIFPDVSGSERAAGSVKYRKVFVHAANDDDLSLVDAKVFVAVQTPGEDSVTLFPGTFVDTQADVTGSEQKYGAGGLQANAISGATSISVITEGATLDIFVDDTLVRISDQSAVGATDGNEEYVRLTADPTYAGAVATLTFTPALAYGYSAVNTRVASVYEHGTVQASVGSFVVTTAGDGDYDDDGYPILADAIASIHQTWTLTFTSATAFTIAGDSLGVIGTGNKSSTTQPLNTAYGKPYFTLSATGFSGTYAIGDTITFVTTPAMIPLWYCRTVPAGASIMSNDSVRVAVVGETA